MKAPIPLGSVPSREVLLVFNLTQETALVLGSLRDLELAGYDTDVVDLSAGCSLPSHLRHRHISATGHCDGSDSRAHATDWLQGIPLARLERTGQSMLDSFRYRGIPLWCLCDIQLQEKAFLVVRLVDKLRELLALTQASRFVIVGSHDQLPWKADVIRAVCCGAGLQEISVGAPVGVTTRVVVARRSTNALRNQIALHHMRLLRVSEEHWMPTTVFALASRLLQGLVTIITPLTGRGRGRWRKLVATQVSMLGAIRRGIRMVRGRTRTPSIVLVEDAGDQRRRIPMLGGARSSYNPYAEGVADRLSEAASRRGITLVRLSYGRFSSARITRSPRQRSMLLARYVSRGVLASAERARRQLEEHWKWLQTDPGFTGAWRYCHVDLWPILRFDFGTAFLSLWTQILNAEAIISFLSEECPAGIIMYNYEGALRGLLVGAVLSRTRVLGLQQALGPYGHALNHFRLGYLYAATPDASGAFPMPTRTCVWGEWHRQNLMLYGIRPEGLSVTGYPRLDTFIAERSRLNRARLLKAFGISNNNAKVITVTVMHRVIGTVLTLRPHYDATIRALGRLLDDDPDVHLLFKPWHGESLDAVANDAMLVLGAGRGRVTFVDPRSEIHNVELLGITDVLIGTFSSIFAEALAMGVKCALLRYPESLQYFGSLHMRVYQGAVTFVDHPSEVYPIVRRLLDADATEMSHPHNCRFVSAFGPQDGNSARRIAEEAIALIAGKDAHRCSSPEQHTQTPV